MLCWKGIAEQFIISFVSCNVIVNPDVYDKIEKFIYLRDMKVRKVNNDFHKQILNIFITQICLAMGNFRVRED